LPILNAPLTAVDPSVPTLAVVDAGELQAAWQILREALPDGWRVHQPAYDPDSQRWSVWAVARPPIRVMPVRGGGATEAEALVNLAATLRARR
jgi:hypothetical protein